jgi:hypothetical protein
MASGVSKAQAASRRNLRAAAQGRQDARRRKKEARELKQTLANLGAEFIRLIRHLFPGFNDAVDDLTDPRDPDLIDYPGRAILWPAILMFVCRLSARRKIHFKLNKPRVRQYVRELTRLTGRVLESLPHGDTVGNVLAVLLAEEVGRVRTDLVRCLIQKRRLEDSRLLGRDYVVALDGTGHLALGHEASKFTAGCLTRRLPDGRTLYYRPVLEAKLVTPGGLALSVETEFVENVPRGDQSEEQYKQDCELSGSKRLLPRLKAAFPKLAICLSLDALYLGEPVFALCEEHRWRFIIVLKEGSLPTVAREFGDLIRLAPENTRTYHRNDATYVLRWVNGIAYNQRTLNVLECVRTPHRTQVPTRWLWVTNLPATPGNALELANKGGRLRWKIENEGFNVQKNGGYAMEHAYAKDPQAAKNFYLLLQIAHLFAQFFERRLGGKKQVAKRFGSLRELAAELLETLRKDPLPDPDDLRIFLGTPIQVRLDSS